jgi:hypothetical protein
MDESLSADRGRMILCSPAAACIRAGPGRLRTYEVSGKGEPAMSRASLRRPDVYQLRQFTLMRYALKQHGLRQPALRRWPFAVVVLAVLITLGCGSSGPGAVKAVKPAANGGPGATGTATGSTAGPTAGGSAAAGGGAATGGSATGGSATRPAGSGKGAPGAPGAAGGNGNGAGGAPGAPGGNGQNGGGGGQAALGAPITIPDIVQLWGAWVASAVNSMEYGAPLPGEKNIYNGVIDQCGGTLCVNVQVEKDPDNKYPSMTHCRATGITIPALGSVVQRGTTVWILTGTQPCPSYEPPWPPVSSGGTSSAVPGGGPSSAGDSSTPSVPPSEPSPSPGVT